MDIGRVQRRFTAEPVDSVIPAAPDAPVEHVETPEQDPATVPADARS
ncbi:hypothetical protein GCM10023201_53360 [Actinomycetospora corticicola]|jgi:hypothetical protein|uniref:Uncharacterized protein n=1 Tax=Actinomycetospora corticicola TaxID=663602 RepID=A0A7Y9DSK3_9PSEU|nr:hypothetical protein [Actinomycetospora corticicola]NYD34412.1 hypothetical protein [Actinomycetospora corticicola]